MSCRVVLKGHCGTLISFFEWVNMKAKDLKAMNIPNSLAQTAGGCIKAATRSGRMNKSKAKELVRGLSEEPENFVTDEHFGTLAAELIAYRESQPVYVAREAPAPWKQWGTDLEPSAIQQMEDSCQLPVSIRGALMPDAHEGYGLPIGGVLATDNAVIPYAVGVDIACRMRLSIYDSSPIILDQERKRFERALEEETRFGKGAVFHKRREHLVMDEDWAITSITRQQKDKAWNQLGTSGGGNHFAEFGEVIIPEDNEFGLKPGRYLALLTHSGSRGPGHSVASHFSRIAQEQHPELPKELQHLAYLSLDSYEGQQYWKAMELMGRYAEANHQLIHHYITKHIGMRAVVEIENHHNFAWLEEHDGKQVVVHRKGATPAGPGVRGLIPGSMGTPAYIVKGLGNPDALNSASHGAGRRMSRKAAKERFTWAQAREFLKRNNVQLLSAGLDEVPMAYKDIEEVMAAQSDLVVPLAQFHPRLVKMANDERRW